MSETTNDDGIDIFDPQTGRMNFDRVMKLFKDNPEELERIQRQAVRGVIDSAPEEYHRQLNGLQFKIDAVRQTSKNPVQSYLRLSQLFWTEGFNKFKDALNGDYTPPEPKGKEGNVVSLFREPPPDSSL